MIVLRNVIYVIIKDIIFIPIRKRKLFTMHGKNDENYSGLLQLANKLFVYTRLISGWVQYYFLKNDTSIQYPVLLLSPIKLFNVNHILNGIIENNFEHDNLTP